MDILSEFIYISNKTKDLINTYVHYFQSTLEITDNFVHLLNTDISNRNRYNSSNTYVYYVSKKSKSKFFTIQEAINATLTNVKTIIFIAPGVYNEKIYIMKDNITLIGFDAKNTILVYNDSKKSVGWTHKTPSVTIKGNNFTAINITFKNSAGKGFDVGPALALSATGDKLAFFNCIFLGHQDTVFVGPDLDIQYKENGYRQYYSECYFEGSCDIIFGRATCYFDKCNIKIVADEVVNVIACNAAFKDTKYGWVFNQCKFVENASNAETFLAWPWKNYSHVVWIDCIIGDHISKKRWEFKLGVTKYKLIIINTHESQYLKNKSLIYSKKNVLAGWNPIL